MKRRLEDKYRAVLIDWTELQSITEQEHRVCLTSRQIAALLSQVTYISWRTRYVDRAPTATDSQIAEFATSLTERLLGACPVDCDEVEVCLGTSPTITNITNDITVIEGDVTVIEGDVTTINQQIAQMVYNSCCNQFPPLPDPNSDPLCGAAHYLTDQLIAFIQSVYDDAATITLNEFLEALLGIGGFDASLAKLLWDYMVANTNPNLMTEVNAAHDEVVKYWYCNSLDRDLTTLDIDASTTITTDAQAALIGGINALTDGKIALWAFVGSQTPVSGDPCLCVDICGLQDFTVDDGGYVHYEVSYLGAGIYQAGTGWIADPCPAVVGTGKRNAAIITVHFNQTLVQNAVMTYDLTKGEVIDPNLVSISMQAWNNGALVVDTHLNFNQVTNGTDKTMQLNINANIDQIILTVSSAVDNPDYPTPLGYGRIKLLNVTC